MKSDSELQKLRYDNKELREASDHFCCRIKALEQIKVIQRKLLVDTGRRAEKLEAALRIFLGEDDRFQVSVGGNPIAVERMLKDARAALAPEQDK